MSFGEKERTLEELSGLIEEGQVDQGALPVIGLLNSRDDYYTTSSCAGRVQLIQMEVLGDKKDSVVLGKWHDGTDLDGLTMAIDSWDGQGYLYLLTQSPIFHVRCRDLDSAARLQHMARDAGFRYSTVRSMRVSENEPSVIVVELLTSYRLDIPLAHQGILYPDKDYLGFLLERCNTVLGLCKERLATLEARLEEDKD